MTEKGISKNVKSKLRADVIIQRKIIHNMKEPFTKAEGQLWIWVVRLTDEEETLHSLLLSDGGYNLTQGFMFRVITYYNIPNWKDRNMKKNFSKMEKLPCQNSERSALAIWASANGHSGLSCHLWQRDSPLFYQKNRAKSWWRNYIH